MTRGNRIYIPPILKVTDVPWHRLTTAYGRGRISPAHLAVLGADGIWRPSKSPSTSSPPTWSTRVPFGRHPFGMVFLEAEF